eukprot:CAMPEP_0184645900 /NCGR_PEP_ID=MMETSP0308-20130426/2494_1 /TAXON_ID=38269 /ORGANISM="Gloeochaete witrockiana, Strain SAG 46.84" /LENGTH=273 /DNA_ID=CAMNT_0027075389 /DNA_START=127 /DNA_END=945 /DNA_ORIENTATION=-
MGSSGVQLRVGGMEFKEGTYVIEELSPQRARSLRIWNGIAAAFQLITGVAIAIVTKKNITYPWYVNFPGNFTERNGTFGVPIPKQVASISVGYLSAAFLLLSFLDHFLVILPGVNAAYNKFIARNVNPFRWLEYSFSASLMHVEIAMLSGITDIHILWSIFGLCWIVMVLGYIFEVENGNRRGKSKNWFSYWIAFVPHMWNWAIILCYFFTIVRRGSPPAFVWAIIFVLFILDATFAVIFGLQWAEVGKFKDYVFGEYGFIILSFTAKQLLAW